jgi:hypothetical protein
MRSSQKFFFFHQADRAKCYELPDALKGPVDMEALTRIQPQWEDPRLGLGWAAITDPPTGIKYYLHSRSRTVQRP